MVVTFNASGPSKGIEMSIVLKDVCKPFVYPTPYELHFSNGHLEWYKTDPEEYIQKMNGTDKDLAAHFTIIYHRGECVYGAPIKEVFEEVPSCFYFDSIMFDVENAEEEITENTMYLTLNLARVLAYKEDGLILSKKEGGEWAIDHLPSEYYPLIFDSIRDYSQNINVIYDGGLAKSYAKYVMDRIRN
jgi:streptomycin 3"-adenylyltransferase